MDRIAILKRACELHTIGRPGDSNNVTIQTCWDADRLDLSRLGITPNPALLCTESARSPEVIEWAWRRGQAAEVSPVITRDWGFFDVVKEL